MASFHAWRLAYRSIVPALAVVASVLTAPAGNAVGAATPVAGTYTALPPHRILDTRAASSVGGGATYRLSVLGTGDLPSSGVTAVTLNVTVTQPGAAGFLAVWPDGGPRPETSNVNFTAGQTVANLVTVAVGADGAIDILNGSSGPTHLVVDVSGWYAAGAAPAPGSFVPLTPARILDTRTGVGAAAGAVPARAATRVHVLGAGGVPTTGVAAVVLNLTVTQPAAAGYLTAFPTGGGAPLTSNLNFGSGADVPGVAVVPIGSGGNVDILNGSGGSAHLVADVSGYFAGGQPSAAGSFVPVSPRRLLDTRTGLGTGCACPASSGTPLRLHLTGLPASVGAVAVNITATQATAPGYVAAYPDGGAPPTVSNLNYAAREDRANLAVVKVGADDTVDLVTATVGRGAVHIVADLAGYYIGGGAVPPASGAAQQPSGFGEGAASPAAPSGQALPGDDVPGWRRVFADDFTVPAPTGSWGTASSSATVYVGDHGGAWKEYPDGWSSTYSSGRPGYQPAQVLSVHDGQLDFFLHPVNGNPSGADPSPQLAGTSGYQTYGMYTARLRISNAMQDYKMAWLLWPGNDRDGECAESDFPEESFSNLAQVYSFSHYGCAGAQDYSLTAVDMTAWHTYTQVWAPGIRQYYLDGKLVGSSTHSVFSGPERWQLQTEPTRSRTGDAGHLLVDWVAAYAYAP